MNKIAAIGYNLCAANRILIDKIIEATLRVRPKIIDIMSDPDWIPTNEDGIVLFGGGGPITKEAVRWKTQAMICTVSAPDLLDADYGNDDERRITWETLQWLKQKLDGRVDDAQPRVLTQDSLPAITANDVAVLEKQNPNGWVGKTKDGKTIRLSARPTDGSEDIKLTYVELFALKVATELLDITEFQLVPNSKTSPSRSS